MIISVKVLISIRYEININGAAFCTVINSARFSHLNPSITPGNHQWKGAAPLFSRKGVQMTISVYGFRSNVNNFSISVFITTMNRSVAEANTCTMKYLTHLTPNGHYMGRTAQLTSRCCILYIYSTNIRTEYFKHAA